MLAGVVSSGNWTEAVAVSGSTPEARWTAILQPYGVNGIRNDIDDPPGVPLLLRDDIVALKRSISLRPLKEDHPNFNVFQNDREILEHIQQNHSSSQFVAAVIDWDNGQGSEQAMEWLTRARGSETRFSRGQSFTSDQMRNEFVRAMRESGSEGGEVNRQEQVQTTDKGDDSDDSKA